MSPEDRVQSYSRAFYEAALERWLGALQEVADRLLADPDLQSRLRAGNVDLGRRQAMLDALLPQDADVPVRNFLYTLLQRGDLTMLPEIVAALRERIVHAGERVSEIEVTSALPLTEKECQQLQGRLERQFGAGALIHYRVDPAILGGVIIRAGDKLIDSSVASRLAGLRQALGIAPSDESKGTP